jgi:hypothetical protein
LIEIIPVSTALAIALAVFADFVHVRGEPERQPVRFLHRVVEGAERIDDRDRPERLLVHRLGIVRQLGDDGRFPEVALGADRMAAGDDLRAVPAGVLEVGLHRASATRVGERAHLDVLLEAVADLERLRVGGELLDELVWA